MNGEQFTFREFAQVTTEKLDTRRANSFLYRMIYTGKVLVPAEKVDLPVDPEFVLDTPAALDEATSSLVIQELTRFGSALVVAASAVLQTPRAQASEGTDSDIATVKNFVEMRRSSRDHKKGRREFVVFKP